MPWNESKSRVCGGGKALVRKYEGMWRCVSAFLREVKRYIAMRYGRGERRQKNKTIHFMLFYLSYRLQNTERVQRVLVGTINITVIINNDVLHDRML